MFDVIDKMVYAMAGVRLLSSLLEMSGAFLMLYFGTAEKALQVNGLLALVGPVVLVTVTVLGIAGMDNPLPWRNIVWIIAGVGCILYGASRG